MPVLMVKWKDYISREYYIFLQTLYCLILLIGGCLAAEWLVQKFAQFGTTCATGVKRSIPHMDLFTIQIKYIGAQFQINDLI